MEYFVLSRNGEESLFVDYRCSVKLRFDMPQPTSQMKDFFKICMLVYNVLMCLYFGGLLFVWWCSGVCGRSGVCVVLCVPVMQ